MTKFSGDEHPIAQVPEPIAIPRRSAGIGRAQMVVLAVSIAAIAWGAWSTRAILDLRARPAPLVKVQLGALVAEYVRTQARSAGSPEQIRTETALFMKSLDASLARRTRDGHVVLVSEAVIGGSVPDITAVVRREIHARLTPPHPASDSGTEARMRDYLQQTGGANGPAR